MDNLSKMGLFSPRIVGALLNTVDTAIDRIGLACRQLLSG